MSRAQLTSTVEQSSGGAVAPFLAGKNKIINGDFGIWQRGTSFSPASVTWTYTADRFQVYNGFSAGTFSVSRQAFTPGTAPVAGYESLYFLRLTAAATGTSNVNIKQLVENVQTFAGQTVTLSFWAKSSAGKNVDIFIRQNFGSGGSASSDSTPSTIVTTTSWQRFTYTVTLASLAGKTIGTGSALEIWPATSANFTGGETLDFWGWQLEAGSIATPFTTASGTLQGELALCQRYYYRNTANQTYQIFAIGAARNTTIVNTTVFLPVQMRTTPTALDYSAVAIWDYAETAFTVSALALGTNQYNNNTVYIGATVSGATQHRPYYLVANNNTAAYIGISAEL
jgi:hypothetical protein